jgi:hypothetical protein
MTRDNALMNTLTVFTNLVTHYPNEVMNLSQYYGQMKLTLLCSKMTEQEIEDLSKQLDYLRIDGSQMSRHSFASALDGTEIKTLEVTWDYE